MRQRLVPALLMIVAALALARPAAAHPHVWLDSVITFVFEGDKLTALRLTWSFDEFFGTAIIRRFDQNRNGRFEPDENAQLEAGAFASLKDYGYFVYMKAGDKPMPVERITGFQGSVRNNQLVYDFTVPLPTPVDPATTEFVLSLFDETYFVEVSLDANDPVRFSGMAPGRCSFVIREEGSVSTFGVSAPQTVALSCRPAP